MPEKVSAYGCNKAEFEQILSSFVVLQKKRPEYVAAVKEHLANALQ
jgi:hypothetical protein